MRIEVVGDDSISHQARTYAEYRLFAALSQHADTRHVRLASLMLRRAKSTRQCDGIVCAITVHLHSGQAARVRAYGTHPYAAINRAVRATTSVYHAAYRSAAGSDSISGKHRSIT